MHTLFWDILKVCQFLLYQSSVVLLPTSGKDDNPGSLWLSQTPGNILGAGATEGPDIHPFKEGQQEGLRGLPSGESNPLSLSLIPRVVCVCVQVIGGYVEHLQELVGEGQRPALCSVTPLLGRDTCFALPGNRKPERRRRKSRAGSLSPGRLSTKRSHRKETTV